MLLQKPIFTLMAIMVVFACMWFWPPFHSRIYGWGRGHHVHTGTGANLYEPAYREVGQPGLSLVRDTPP